MKESSKLFGCYLFILKIFSPASWLEVFGKKKNKGSVEAFASQTEVLGWTQRPWRALLGAFCILTELVPLSLSTPCWDCPLLYTIQILDLLLNLRAKKAHQIEHLIKTQDLFVCVIIQCVKINASVFNK